MTPSNTPRPPRARAVVFDLYGTLLDVTRAVDPARAVLGARADRLGELWRRKQLELSWLRSLMRAHRDFAAITEDALGWAMATVGVEDAALARALRDAFERLPAFPDAAATLDALRAAGLHLAVLSNGTPAMLETSLATAGLRDRFDLVLSVEPAGIFKPAPEVYRLATAALERPAAEIAFVSANAWDAHGAAWNGFLAIRVDRTGQPEDPLPGAPAHRIASLAELPRILGA
ncbi:MAG: haloacid dehalogenase [Geminicoccaceae bacterium]|jgi:2-haloacid dehalogenase|nr:MAG: haloacid dehalogenase [Geminicoccaceae bacterium]